MGNIASIHIEPSKDNNTVHNDRTIAPDYLLTHKSLGVEVDNKYDVADAIYTAKLNSATEAYANRVGQKIQAKKIKWSAVVNINENTTMEDLKKLTSFLEEKYGWQCYQIAVHRDEGHIDKESGETIYNLHAHLELLMLDKNGIYRFKKRDFGKKKMAALQTEVADILGLERGISREERLEMVAEKLGVNVADIKQRKNEKHDAYVNRIKAFAKTKGFEDFNIFKEIKGSVRQTHQQYKQQKRSEEKIKADLKEAQTSVNELNKLVLSLAEQKKQVEAERKKYKEQGDHIAKEYRALQALNKTLHTQEELDNALASLRKQYEERIKSKDKEITELADNNTVLSNSNKSLEEKLDNYTVLYNNSIHEQNLAQTDLRTFPTLEELTYDRFNLETQYGIRQVYNYEAYRGDKRKEQSLQGLSERSLVHQRTVTDLPLHVNEVSKLRDGDIAEVQHQLLRTVYSETMIYSVNPRTDRVLSVEDQIRYNTLYQMTEEYVKKVQQPLSIEEIENLPRVQELKKEVQSLKDFYAVKPSDFSFRVTADDLKTKKFGLFHEETAQGTADRINREIRKQIGPIIQSNKSLEQRNIELNKKNKQLEEEKSNLNKLISKLTRELKTVYEVLCIPMSNEIKERMNSLKEWVSDFLNGDNNEIERMRNRLIRKAEEGKKQQPKKTIEKNYER